MSMNWHSVNAVTSESIKAMTDCHNCSTVLVKYEPHITSKYCAQFTNGQYS